MEKNIVIDGKEIPFKATASTPRRYRQIFHKDVFVDMGGLIKNVKDEIPLTAEMLEAFENIAWLMAKQADETIPDNPDDWLDQFALLSIYDVLPEIVALWINNEQTLSESKKKQG